MNELSGGEKQIISICCALIQDTKIIVLDEPTSALDFSNQNNVLSTLKKIAFDEEKLLILSTHNPNHALYLNSKVVIIKNGSVLYFDYATNIINTNILSLIYSNSICYSKDLPYDEISFKGAS